jgi:hypothetical protein
MQFRHASIFAVMVLFLAMPGALWAQDRPGGSTDGSAAQVPVWSGGTIERFLPNLSAEERSQLISERELKNFYTDTVQLSYAPELDLWKDIEPQLEDMEPSVGVEILFYYPVRPERLDDTDFRRDVYNVLRSVSTMEGIKYYSASRERMRIFYHESYVIEGPENRDRVPDPTVETIPKDSTIHIFQRDSSFGKNVYEARYRYADGTYVLSLVNLTRMYYKVFPVVAPQNVKINLAVMLTERGIVFYGNTAVDVITLLGLQERVQDSFYNRLVAIYDWFKAQIKDTAM